MVKTKPENSTFNNNEDAAADELKLELAKLVKRCLPSNRSKDVYDAIIDKRTRVDIQTLDTFFLYVYGKKMQSDPLFKKIVDKLIAAKLENTRKPKP